MKRFVYGLMAVLALTFLSTPVFAQQTTQAIAVSSCGTPPYTPVAGQPYVVTMDLLGKLCVNTSVSFAGAVTIADGADVTLGAKADGPCATAATACTLEARIAKLEQAAEDTAASAIKIDQTSTNNNVAFVAGSTVGLAAAATGGCTLSGNVTTASTNATNIKASAGTLCGGHAVNTTGTLAYVRWYNLAATPTCSSATGYVASTPVPANASGAGIIFDMGPFGAAFSTGISFCVTGGGSSTDNTNAPAGVYVNPTFK